MVFEPYTNEELLNIVKCKTFGLIEDKGMDIIVLTTKSKDGKFSKYLMPLYP
jgi:hypothetical protein